VQANKLRPVPWNRVVVDDRFWAPKIKTNREVSIPLQLEQIRKTGRLDNLRRAGGKLEGRFEGIRFNDSDVYKWLDAAAYSLGTHPDPELEAQVNAVIEVVAAAQQESGYIHSYFTLERPDARFACLAINHELYCAGHLFEAAVTHYEATGSRALLDVALKFADHVWGLFGPGKRDGYPGHEEIELALVKLHRVTGRDRYLTMAQRFIDLRGSRPSPFEAEFAAESAWKNVFDAKRIFYKGDQYDGSYAQDHLPVREQSEVVGHAVRAMYLFSAMADLAAATGDQGLIAALDRLWTNLTTKRMYVTGGIGPSRHNEGFTSDFDLPNQEAYAETCAAIGLVFWAHRMALLHRNATYADVMELALYNGVLSGVSLDGEKYFYVNPLQTDGTHHRQEWFYCACCPPNIARLLASLGGYVCAESDDGLWVNLYVAGTCQARLGGTEVTLRQTTDYPWSGEVGIVVEPQTPLEFELRLRVPRWCRAADVSINDGSVPLEAVDGYIGVRREWRAGDRVRLLLGMGPEHVVAHPDVIPDVGRAAVRRGPIVYCLEQADHDGPVSRIILPAEEPLEEVREPDLLGGVITLGGTGYRLFEEGWDGHLYRADRQPAEQIPLKFIPYYAWDNREPGDMAVWIPVCLAQGGLVR
jgi:DUF1680 family protein